jgi:hypothetical protein
VQTDVISQPPEWYDISAAWVGSVGLPSLFHGLCGSLGTREVESLWPQNPVSKVAACRVPTAPDLEWPLGAEVLDLLVQRQRDVKAAAKQQDFLLQIDPRIDEGPEMTSVRLGSRFAPRRPIPGAALLSALCSWGNSLGGRNKHEMRGVFSLARKAFPFAPEKR